MGRGLPLSPADLDRAVELALKARPELADREIAGHVGTDIEAVHRARFRLAAPEPQTGGLSGQQRRILAWLLSVDACALPGWGVPWRATSEATPALRTAMSRALASLERRGLVMRHSMRGGGPTRFRATHVELLPAGRKLLASYSRRRNC